MKLSKARAHTNIALIKYWGKADQALILPATSSISMTLAAFYTDTAVTFDAALTADTFTLDGKLQSPQAAARVTQFLDLVRQRAGIATFARVQSDNHVPTAAGLASSASAFAALALAASDAAGLELTPTELSRLARRGSGSASRSIFGDMVIWHRGTDDGSSFAEPLPINPKLDLRMIAVVVDDMPKSIGSRVGMQRTVATSPYFPAWVTANEAAASAMQQALADGDMATVGALTERSAMMMHASTMAANPPFTYLQPVSLALFDYAAELRVNGFQVYATADAGPNVKLLTTAQDADRVLQQVQAKFNVRAVMSGPGPAARIID